MASSAPRTLTPSGTELPVERKATLREPVEIFDSTLSTEQEKTIEEFVIMESDHHWRTFAIIDKGTTAVIYNMAYVQGIPPQNGLLKISRTAFFEPIPYGVDTGVFTLTNSRREPSRVNALFRVKPTEPRMTVADLTKFIISADMHDFTFVNVQYTQFDVAGCRYWHICLVGELEQAGKVPLGTAEAFVRFIKMRSDKLKETIKTEPDDQLVWPTIPGIFNTAKLTYTRSKVDALHAKAEQSLKK